jgi:hypothetical protein
MAWPTDKGRKRVQMGMFDMRDSGLMMKQFVKKRPWCDGRCVRCLSKMIKSYKIMCVWFGNRDICSIGSCACLCSLLFRVMFLETTHHATFGAPQIYQDSFMLFSLYVILENTPLFNCCNKHKGRGPGPAF